MNDLHEKPKRPVAGYVRVSTFDQSHEMQIVALERYAERHGLVIDIFEEKGSGSATAKRPILEALWKDLLNGEYDALYVWDFDRFARSLIHLITAMEALSQKDIPFISLQNPELSIRTPMGRAMFQIISVLAELERNLIAERTRTALRLKKEQGMILGPPPKAMLKLPKDANLWKEGIRKMSKKYEVSESTISRARKVIPWVCHKPLKK